MFNESMVKRGTERSVIRELFEYGNARKAELGEEAVCDFSIGNPSVPPPPEFAAALREVTERGEHGYSSAAGLPEVRAAVAEHFRTAFGIPMSASLVYMTCGAAASLVILFSAALREGDEVLVPAPYFPEYAVFLEQAGAKLVPVPTKDFRLDLSALRAAVTDRTRAVLINSPNNPTGVVYTAEELRGLARLLEEEDRKKADPILLISDEPYREIVYGAPSVCPMTVYPDTVVLYSFSKSLSLAGERIGYIAVSPACKDAATLFDAVCGAGRYHGYICAPVTFQRAAAACLGRSADVSVYRANRDLLMGALSDMGYSFAPAEGAFYLFMKALEEDDEAFSERAKSLGLLLVPSKSFGCRGYVRVSYCVPREVIERSLPLFRALMAAYRA